MITFPVIPEGKLIERLMHPGRKVRVVLDTDTFNEIDDQFAVVYAMKSPERMQLEAFYAAPFYNHLSTGAQDGMEKSYRELKRIAGLIPEMTGLPIHPGSSAYLSGQEKPVDSEAARDLVARAMASPDDDPLYVIAIGAITNVASAILMEPRIIEKIVVIWLGGHALHWSDTKEFNLGQDFHASRLVLDCGVPLILIPCMGVTSHLLTTLSELKDYIKETGEIGAYLYETYKGCSDNHCGYSRVIWDIAAVAYLANEEWVPSHLVQSPVLSEGLRWSFDHHRHLIRYVHHVDRDNIFRDFFRKLG